jgi:hypothetical protein
MGEKNISQLNIDGRHFALSSSVASSRRGRHSEGNIMTARYDKNMVELPSMERDGQPANQSESWLAALPSAAPIRIDLAVGRFADTRFYA